LPDAGRKTLTAQQIGEGRRPGSTSPGPGSIQRAMAEPILTLTEPAPAVALVTLNRPQAANAFDTALALAVAETFERFAHPGEAARCVVLTGAGEKAFCAGADLKERDGMDDHAWAAQHQVFEAMAQAILASPMPVIAAVNGAAFGGGCEIALLCDFIYAAETARFALPEATLGIMPGLGATQTLARAAGPARAKEVILTGAPFTADEAMAWGVVNRVCAPASLLEEALATAARIAASAPLSARAIKRAIEAGSGASLPRGMEIELEAYNGLFPTADRLEGVKAWREKRRPQFRGH
jgi:enoyl-CoA hydratase/carnithine racemase